MSGSYDRELVRTRTRCSNYEQQAITAAGQRRIHTGLRSPDRVGSVAKHWDLIDGRQVCHGRPVTAHVEIQGLLEIWQEHHGVLSPELRDRFLSKEMALALCHYPDEIIRRVVEVHPKLADSLQAARVELGLRRDLEDEAGDSGGSDLPQGPKGGSGQRGVGLVDLAESAEVPDEIRRLDQKYRRDTADEELPPDPDGFSFDQPPERGDSDDEEKERQINDYSDRTGTYRCHACQSWFPLAAFRYSRRGRIMVARRCASCRQRPRRQR